MARPKKLIVIKHKDTGEVLLTLKAGPYLDLRHAKLEAGDLSGLTLVGDFEGATLAFANMEGAILQGAYLAVTDLTHTNLRGADLTGCILRDANLRWANLEGANFTGAELQGTNLIGAWLEGALFTRTVLWDTIFADCYDPHKAIDLDKTEHSGPSSIDIRTLRACLHDLPVEFLRGIGLSQEEIEGLYGVFPRVKK